MGGVAALVVCAALCGCGMGGAAQGKMPPLVLSAADADGEVSWPVAVGAGDGPGVCLFVARLPGPTVPDSAAYDLLVDGEPAVRFGAVWDGKRFESGEGIGLERVAEVVTGASPGTQEHLYVLTLPRSRMKGGTARLSLRHGCPERATLVVRQWTDWVEWKGK